MTSFRSGAAAAALAVLLAGCALMGEFTPSDSLIGAWQVEDIDGQGVSGGPVVVTFDETSRVSGSAGCNRFTGAYAYDSAASTLRITPLGSTRMMCAPAVMTQERRLIAALQDVTSVESSEDGATVLKTPTGRIQLRRRGAPLQTPATKAGKPPEPAAPAASNPYGASTPLATAPTAAPPAYTPPAYAPPYASAPPDAAPDVSAQVSATGELYILERIALPPGAVVRIQLRDAARAGAPALVLAQQEFAAGAGGPYPFSISAPSNVVPANARLTLFAQILSAGRLLFITDTNNPVAAAGTTSAMSIRLVSAAPGARPAPAGTPDAAPRAVMTLPATPVATPAPAPSTPSSTPLAGGPGAFAAPAPSLYRCGGEEVRVAFDASMAWMTTQDGVLAVPRVNPSDDPFAQRMYSNNRLTFIQDQGANPRVQFSRGRMALMTCDKIG